MHMRLPVRCAFSCFYTLTLRCKACILSTLEKSMFSLNLPLSLLNLPYYLFISYWNSYLWGKGDGLKMLVRSKLTFPVCKDQSLAPAWVHGSLRNVWQGSSPTLENRTNGFLVQLEGWLVWHLCSAGPLFKFWCKSHASTSLCSSIIPRFLIFLYLKILSNKDRCRVRK